MNSVGLMDNGPEAFGTGNGPRKERNGRNGGIDRLDGKQMADFVNRKPEGWKRAGPKNEKAHKVHGVDTSARRKTVVQIAVAGPDGSNHQCHTLACLSQHHPSALDSCERNAPPMYDCTPYQITAMAALLKTGQKDPQIPKDARAATGNEIW